MADMEAANRDVEAASTRAPSSDEEVKQNLARQWWVLAAVAVVWKMTFDTASTWNGHFLWQGEGLNVVVRWVVRGGTGLGLRGRGIRGGIAVPAACGMRSFLPAARSMRRCWA